MSGGILMVRGSHSSNGSAAGSYCNSSLHFNDDSFQYYLVQQSETLVLTF